jgi:hypothetical protein
MRRLRPALVVLALLALGAPAAARTLSTQRTADPFGTASPIADLRPRDHVVTLHVGSAPRRRVDASLVIVCARMDGRSRMVQRRLHRRRTPVTVTLRRPRLARSRCSTAGDARLSADAVPQGFRWRLWARLSAR